jgi:hypothetical protein
VRRAFRNEFVRYAEKVSGARVPFAYAVERGVGGDNPHIHALLCIHGAMRIERLSGAWRHGRVTIEAYDPARGAASYLSKTFGHLGAEWDISSTLPPTQLARERSPADNVGCWKQAAGQSGNSQRISINPGDANGVTRTLSEAGIEGVGRVACA